MIKRYWNQLGKLDQLYIVYAFVLTASTFLFFGKLPDQLGVHMNRGAFDQYLDKRLYSMIMPVLLAGYFYYSRIHRADGPQNRMFLLIILTFAQVMVLYTNLVGAIGL